MRRRLLPSGLIIAASAAAALLLSFTQPSPQGLVGFGVGDREVRAAPGATAHGARQEHNLTALEIFNRTLVRIRDSYVDPGRIDPQAMLYGALDAVQRDIPEVMIEVNEDANEFVIHVKDESRAFSTAGVDSPWRLSGKLKKIFRFIESHIPENADLAAVEYAAVNGMLATLDPHSSLLDPEMARQMDASTSGEFGGLGIVIEMRDQKLTVVEPMDDTPAMRAGVEADDHVIKIDDEVTENLTLQEAVDRMRGTPGSEVTIAIEREGEDELLEFELTRERIQVPSVETELLTGNVGYLNVGQFASRTADELRQHMDDLRDDGAEAWILDLRQNPGGLLEQAVLVADLFVDQGTLVTTVGGREREPRRATSDDSETELPMAVLVSGVSASASEIVAGSLKNLDRALVLGSNTFGKGSVQILYDNDDGSKLKLTIAEYLTPGDQSIQSRGIVPDIELHRMLVPPPDRMSGLVRLLPPTRRHRESDLKAHLDSEYASPAKTPKTSFRYLHELERDEAEVVHEEGEPPGDVDQSGELPDEPPPGAPTAEGAAAGDIPVELARRILAESDSPSRSEIFERARPLLRAEAARERDKLADALNEIDVDWSAPPDDATGTPRLDAEFSIEAPGGVISAGDEVEVVGEIENVGSGTAYQVHARVEEADYSLFRDVELVFGRIEPGESESWTTTLSVPDSARDRIDVLSFQVRSARDAPARALPLKARIEAAERPVFAYSHQLIDEGNGDGLVQEGERQRLRVTIRNEGEGAARDTAAILRNTSGDDLTVRQGRFELGELEPDATETVEFVFDVADSVDASDVVVEMNVSDRVLRESVSDTLVYPIASPSAGPADRSGFARAREDGLPIYQGASRASGRVASASEGTSFPVTGALGDWLRIEIEDGRPGFVRADGVSQSRRPARTGAIEPHWQVVPPRLDLSFPSYETRADTYTLDGTVTDNSGVEDVYIFVSNREENIDSRKVFYQSNRGSETPAELAFRSEIPLWPGTNRVTVVARESADVKSQHTAYIYRHTSTATASATARVFDRDAR